MRGIFQKDLEMMNISKSWILLLLASVACLLRGVWSLLGVVFLLPFCLSLFWNKHHDFGLVLPWKWYHLVLSRVIWLLITLIPAFLSGILWMILDQKIFRVLDALAACGILLAAGCALLLLCLPTWLRKSKTASKQSARKSTGVYIKILAVLGYAMVAAGFCIFALIMFTFGGMRLTPQAAAEWRYYDAARWQKIEFGEYIVYYTTNNTIDEYSDKWIDDILPVERNGIFYEAVYTENRSDDPQQNFFRPVWNADTGELVGELCWFEVDGFYHYFFIPPVTLRDWTQIPEFVRLGYDKVTVNGHEIDIFKHSYFITDVPVEDFEISGISLTINDPGVDPPPVEYIRNIAIYCDAYNDAKFSFDSNGTFRFVPKEGHPQSTGVYEKTETGIILYFREKGEIVETVELTFKEDGKFFYKGDRFRCTNKEDVWDAYPLYTKPAC